MYIDSRDTTFHTHTNFDGTRVFTLKIQPLSLKIKETQSQVEKETQIKRACPTLPERRGITQ